MYTLLAGGTKSFAVSGKIHALEHRQGRECRSALVLRAISGIVNRKIRDIVEKWPRLISIGIRMDWG